MIDLKKRNSSGSFGGFGVPVRHRGFHLTLENGVPVAGTNPHPAMYAIYKLHIIILEINETGARSTIEKSFKCWSFECSILSMITL